MSNANSAGEKCPHGRIGYEDCEGCEEADIVAFIAGRVAEQPTITAAEVLAEIIAGRVHDVTPGQHAANLAAWMEQLSPETKAAMVARAPDNPGHIGRIPNAMRPTVMFKPQHSGGLITGALEEKDS